MCAPGVVAPPKTFPRQNPIIQSSKHQRSLLSSRVPTLNRISSVSGTVMSPESSAAHFVQMSLV